MAELKKVFTVKNILEFLFILVLYRSFEFAGAKKYAIAVLFCLILLVLARKKKWKPEALCVAIPAVAYVVLGGFAGMLQGTYQYDAVKIIVYNLLAFVLAFSMYAYYGKDLQKIVDLQFGSCIAVYLSLTIVYMVTRFSRVESTFAFAFGIFTIYYAYKKRWKMFLLATIFMYLADKRIVLLAVLVSLFLIGLLWFFENNKKLVWGIWGGTIVLVYSYLYLIYSGIMDAFCWGANINTNGRVEMYSRMANEYEFSVGFLGEGLGVVETLLGFWNVEKFANLHNDLLKFYIELGFIGLFIYLLSYCLMFYVVDKAFNKSKMCFMVGISVYSMLLYATDNVSLYVMYLFPMYSVFFAVLSSEPSVKIKGK